MNAEVTSQLEELEAITRKMDVPEFRRRKVAWLERNLCVRNAQHPRYDEAMELIRALVKQGVR